MDTGTHVIFQTDFPSGNSNPGRQVSSTTQPSVYGVPLNTFNVPLIGVGSGHCRSNFKRSCFRKVNLGYASDASRSIVL